MLDLPPGTDLGPYVVGERTLEWGGCAYYEAADAGKPVLLKTGDPLALGNEMLALKSLLDEPDPRLVPYLPNPIGFYNAEVEVFGAMDGFYTLAEVHEAYPRLDPRDMAWMYRRLLVALGFAHQADMIHGAVLPEAVRIHPEKHGLILCDWQYAQPWAPDAEAPEDLDLVKLDEYKGWYPPEDMATPEADIYMAAVLMIWLIGGDPTDPMGPLPVVEREYRTFFSGSVTPDYTARFGDAWTVQEYFDSLLEKLYGPRTYRPFHMEPQ